MSSPNLTGKLSQIAASTALKPTINVGSLTTDNPEGFPVFGCRQLSTKFGPAVIVTVEVDNGQIVDAFLPSRFAISLTKSEVDIINSSSDFRIKSTGVVINKSPTVLIWNINDK